MPKKGRRENIVEAAIALFGTKGYHATSVRDIAEAAGMLSGSLYAHIRSKEDLLYEIALTAGERALAELEPVVRGSAPPEEKLRQAIRDHVRRNTESQALSRLATHEWRYLQPARREKIRVLRERYEELLDEVLVELGIAEPKFARLLVLSAAQWTMVWYDPEGPLGPGEVADRFTALILDGIRPLGRDGALGAARGRATGAARR